MCSFTSSKNYNEIKVDNLSNSSDKKSECSISSSYSFADKKKSPKTIQTKKCSKKSIDKNNKTIPVIPTLVMNHFTKIEKNSNESNRSLPKIKSN